MTSEEPGVTPEQERADQIMTIATDLETLGRRAREEAETGDIATATASLQQTFDLFAAVREAGILP